MIVVRTCDTQVVLATHLFADKNEEAKSIVTRLSAVRRSHSITMETLGDEGSRLGEHRSRY